MSVAGHRPLPLERIGGLRTLDDATRVPAGWSPDCRDVEFLPGLVRTRPGLADYGFSHVNLNFPIRGAFNYMTPGKSSLLVEMDANGELFLIDPETGNTSSIGYDSSTIEPLTNPGLRGTQLFDQAWLAVTDGTHGVLPARRIFATTYASFENDPIAPDGPHLGTLAAADSASGGNVSAGVHRVTVFFVTRSGYFTRPAQLNFKGATSVGIPWTATGAKKVDVSGIPTGPNYVIKRILAFTIAGGAEFFYLPDLTEINDNTSTTLTVDFTDQQLTQEGVNVDHLARRIIPSHPGGIEGYADRLIFWGCLNSLNFESGGNEYAVLKNMGFDGGFGGDTPLGWVSGGAGHLKSTTSLDGGFSVEFNAAGQKIVQGLGSSVIFEPGKSYSIRIYYRAQVDAGAIIQIRTRLTNGGAALPSSPGQTDSFSGGFGPETFPFEAFEFEIWAQNEAALASGLQLEIDCVASTGGQVWVDRIDVYPTAQKYLDSLAYVSNASDAEAIDGTTGFIEPSSGEGQAVRDLYELRNNLYIAKERSLHVTQDNGETPDQWSTAEVSERVGAVSTRGTADGDEWNVLVNRAGLWLHIGGILSDADRLTTEIQPTWDEINWEYGHRVEVLVDVKRKRILVSAPVGVGQTTPNRIFALDYTEGLGIEQRKWSPWFIAANTMLRLERANGTEDILLGGTKTYRLDPAAFDDDGAAINSYWQSHYFAAAVREQFGYLTMAAYGAGQLSLDVFRGSQGDVRSLRAFTLPADERFQLERMLNIQREAVAFRVGTNRAGEHFTLTSFVPWVQPAPWAAVRGKSA